ncbi:MAG: SDR family oxidoreductase [Chitinophagaceae bacterium]|nr:MAG: SDR family oxidoreductase [Chitinophagaceae bacterium]
MKKTILVTGASSGIGRDTVKYFQSRGWNVLATMRQPANDTELAQLENVVVTRLDVLDNTSVETAVALGIRTFGKIDVVLNNAGYGAYGPLESFSRESIIRQFDTNVIGLLDVTRALLPHFRSNRDGIIINISSVGGKLAFPFGSLYHGTKFAVEGISESLDFELREFGVKVKIVEPGAVATDFKGRSMDISNDETLLEYQPLLGKVIGAMDEFFVHASAPVKIAEVIFEAATDGKNQLRYIAGEDARQMIGARKQLDDESLDATLRMQFGL